jgi:hypothetical protein
MNSILSKYGNRESMIQDQPKREEYFDQANRQLTDASWFDLFWSIGAGFIAKHLASALNDVEQQVGYVDQIVERGCTRAEATEAWRTAVEKKNGQITKEFRFLYDMQAKLANGVPESCGG